MIGVPVIAVAVNTGGHRESATTLVLYRANHGVLEQLFAAIVEEHEGPDAWHGSVTFVPNGLTYRAPRSTTETVWTYDSHRGRYVERASLPPPPHDEPNRAPLA
jgi:hypothetical protein